MKKYLRPAKFINNTVTNYEGFLPSEIGKETVEEFPKWMRENGFASGSVINTNSALVDVIDENGDILSDFPITSDGLWFIINKLNLKVTSEPKSK